MPRKVERVPGEREGEGTRLRRRGLAPKRRFGQHFLFNPRLLDYVITQAGIVEGMHVLEVGPGSGALTRRMLARGAAVTAVEIDRGLCRVLREELSDEHGFTLIEGDALAGKHRMNEELRAHLASAGRPFKLVANLPFNAATPLLMLVLEDWTLFSGALVTVQDEVADRFVATPGTGTYGVISVLAQVLAVPRKLLKIGRQSFSPPPKVDAAVLQLTPRTPPLASAALYGAVKEVVAEAFGQRRKKLRPRIAARWPAAEGACPADARPEEISPSGYVAIAELVAGARP